MILITDEDVLRSVVDFLSIRGHDVRLAVEELLPPTKDATIAAKADQLSAIIVTCDRDFDKLIQRNKLRYRSAGRITLRCDQARAHVRLSQGIDLIECEYTRRQALQDRRIIVDVRDYNVVFQG